MSRCPTCGGELITFGSSHRYCTFCGNSYGADAASSQAQPVSNAQKKSFDTGANVFESNINSVLEIQWTDGRYTHSGSGFVISPDGYAITNTHVVTAESGASCGTVNVHFGGQTAKADVLQLGDSEHGLGRGIDLALIKIKGTGNLKTTRFADFDQVRIGEQVFVIGNSLGHGTCITSGIVSDKRRDVDGKPLLMTDCAINGGNSGGPMFNAAGEVIAVIVSGITGAEGMNFAIPVDDVMDFINRCGININYRKSN